jgi:Zn-dependent peptidase ImmA (M78 family)/transcriptional regulator with XRE-family HTH domain
MPIDQATLGKRLRDARVNRGLTQEEAAEHLGIPRTAVVNIESGERSISTLEVTELARLYRRSIAELLSESAGGDEDIFVVLHRIDPEFADDPAVKDEVARHVAICREGTDLRELLGMPTEGGPPEYGLPAPGSTMEAVEQGNLVAAHERRRLSLGTSPLPDLAKLIASQGVWAAKAALPDEMSGMFLHHRSFGMAVLINQKHPLPRRRFSFAHEYSHALMDRRASATVTTQRNRKDFVEVRANAFAAAFLLPAEGVQSFLRERRKALPSREEQIVYDALTEDVKERVEARSRNVASFSRVTYQDAASLSLYFGTSYQAACYRLKSLGFVDKEQLEELLNKEGFADAVFRLMDLADGADTGGREDSRGDEDILRLQVLNLAIEAYRREMVSQGRLREISSVLGIAAEELLELAEAA